jgi:hypothetical protein
MEHLQETHEPQAPISKLASTGSSANRAAAEHEILQAPALDQGFGGPIEPDIEPEE